MGTKNSNAGGIAVRSVPKISFAFSIEPLKHHTIAHIFLKWRCSGNGGPGGTVMNAKKPFISSGAFTMNSRYHFITAAA